MRARRDAGEERAQRGSAMQQEKGPIEREGGGGGGQEEEENVES